MFKRVILEDWQFYVPYICFALIGVAFIAIIIRVVRMEKSDVDHLANLPLRNDLEERDENS